MGKSLFSTDEFFFFTKRLFVFSCGPSAETNEESIEFIQRNADSGDQIRLRQDSLNDR